MGQPTASTGPNSGQVSTSINNGSKGVNYSEKNTDISGQKRSSQQSMPSSSMSLISENN